MSTMPLFLDQDLKPTFEKLGSSVRLGDDPANWQVEVAAEIYKQLPFLADYAVNVVFDRVSPERGYASGTAEVTNKTDAPLPEQPAASLRIPLIVKERVLQPLDVMLSDSKAYPLNERRVRETLFRTDTFEMSTRKPVDKGMVDQLYPPLRTNYGYGNSVATGVGVGGMGKQASLEKLGWETADSHIHIDDNYNPTHLGIWHATNHIEQEQAAPHDNTPLHGVVPPEFHKYITRQVMDQDTEHPYHLFEAKIPYDEALKHPEMAKEIRRKMPEHTREMAMIRSMMAARQKPMLAELTHDEAEQLRGMGKLGPRATPEEESAHWKARAKDFQKQAGLCTPNSLRWELYQHPEFIKQAKGKGGKEFAKLVKEHWKDIVRNTKGKTPGFTSAEQYNLTHRLGKTAGLLEAIAPTIPQAEIDQFVAKVANDHETRLLALRNPEFEKAALMLAATKPVSIEKTAAALVESIPPTVVQFQKLASGDFLVKWANAEAFNPQQGQVDPGTAAGMAGTDKVLGMGPDQTLTVSTDRAKKETLQEEKIEVAQDFGQFRVREEETGEDLVGWVLPISDFDMQSMPLFLWTDGGEKFSVQAEIAGSRCGHDLNLPATGPQGTGCFYYLDNERARAFLPMTIRNHITDEKGSESFQGETLFGEQITLTPTPGLQATQEIEEGHYAIPEELRWMALGEAVHLFDSPDEFDTQDNLQQAPGAVDVKSTGPGEFSMDGAPLAKVARELKTFIKQAEAEFLLVAMGLSQFEAQEKLAAAKGGYQTVKIAGLRSLTPLDVVHRELLKQAATFLEQFPYGLRRDLVKEAAALEDSETVDSILSMGFLNPENVQTFANYMPQLEETAQKLAEMLMAARLGMTQFDEGAIQRAMTNLEDVIQGLRALEQKGLVKA